MNSGDGGAQRAVSGYRDAMQFHVQRPGSSLARFVEHFWCLSDAPLHQRERVLPSGNMELVINLDQDELRIYDRDRPERHQRYAGAAVAGAYSRYFVIDTREHASIIGAHFRPGGALPFFDLPCAELADSHVELQQLWGASARVLREQLCEARSPQQRLQLLERALLERLDLGQARRRASGSSGCARGAKCMRSRASSV